MTITIQEIITQISQRLQDHSETPVLDTQVLLAHILKKPRSWVMAHPEILLDNQQQQKLNLSVTRLEKGEALPYIIGHREFYGVDFHLTPDVLIPRPETELLVQRAIDWLNLHPHARKAIDVGTGSGCIGITLAMNIPSLHVRLTDISLLALDVAKENADIFNLSDRLEFQQADLLEGVEGIYDLICANLPYIPSQVLSELPVSKSEPQLALDGGENGIELITRLLDQARNRMAPGGLMLLEIEASQGVVMKSIAEGLYPATKITVHKDLSGRDRCLEIGQTELILHLCQREEWLKAQNQGVFSSKSLEQEGFIHCSQPEQILQVANHFYHGIPDLILLWIEPELITSEIRWEMADNTLFPHIYGPIDLKAVIRTTDLKPEVDGYYHLLQLPD
jgi:release factor glutamine methyltransferase